VLNVRQTAEFFGTTEKCIRKRIERGMLPYRKLGARIVFVRTELEDFVSKLPGLTIKDAELNALLRSGQAMR
jgi:hypothetical protein